MKITMGSIKWNLVAGILTFIFTFLLSLGDNLLLTSLLKGLYGFVIMFLALFVVRIVLAFLLAEPAVKAEPVVEEEQANETPHVGKHLDLKTPDEDSGMEFAPLSPPKLTTNAELDSQQVVQAVRHLTAEEGR